MMTIARLFAFAAVTCILVGCQGGAKVAPVSGVVTLDGKPLANAHIVFQPMASGGKTDAGTGSYALTDTNGAYTLRLADNDQQGAVIGKHRVEINLKVESDDRANPQRPPPKVLPAKYNRNTELQFEVKPGGSTAANFDLKKQ
jgi:hypothetical protein